MAVLAECPQCHRKQATKNKVCACGRDLDKAKRSKLVRYWIQYRLPGGKQKKEFVGDSIEEARDADGKRRGQKRENRIFDIKPEAKMTFQELTDWYLGLEKVKAIKSHWRIRIGLENFNSQFGNVIVSQIKPIDIENYQVRRKAEGTSDGTVDKELTMVQTMISKAFDNDIVGGDTLKTFKKVKRLLKTNANARDRVLSLDEYHRLMEHLPVHLKPIVATAFFTGMRRGEILNLTWDKVDLGKRMVRLEAEDTKDGEPRYVPYPSELSTILEALPRGLHDNHVFLYKGQPVSDIRTGLRDGCQKAGISYGQKVKNGFVFHDLRHSYNTHMRKAGVPESVIMKMTGHATRQMFDRYNTVDGEDARQAVEQMQTYLVNVTQNVTQEAQN